MPPQGEGSVSTLDVATWNIHGGRGLDHRYELDQVVELIERRDPDVIGLQEVDRAFRSASDFDDQLDILRDELDMQARFGGNLVRESADAPGDSGGAYGIAVLCKRAHQIESSEHYLLPQSEDDESAEQRGLLETEIAVGDRTLFFYTTHLTTIDALRSRQVSAVLDIVARRPGPKVLVGDFNATPDAGSIELVRQRFDDAAVLAGCERHATYPSDVPTRRIDYIFASPGVSVEEYTVVDEVASDHLLVEATLDEFH